MPQDKSKELLEAIRAGNKPAVDSLLQQEPALLGFKAPNGSSAILLATYYGHAELTEVFLRHGAKLDVFEASATGNLEGVRQLVEGAPARVNSFAPDGFYPLGLAAFFGHREIVQLLLEHGADVHLAARNAQRVTALHAAVARRDAETVGMLLKRGADPNARRRKGSRPFTKPPPTERKPSRTCLSSTARMWMLGRMKGKRPTIWRSSAGINKSRRGSRRKPKAARLASVRTSDCYSPS
jgi:uncharacterized protein